MIIAFLNPQFSIINLVQAPSVIGHQEQLEALQRDLELGNVTHAYLFTGPAHIGKCTVAKWFALQLFLEGVDDEKDRSRVALEVDRLIHPDLFVIERLWVEGICEDFDLLAKSTNISQWHRSRAHAKTDSISIEDIRVLQERLFEVGTGRFRCCLIREVGRMHDEAVNALLKILEEPPEGLTFLLTTETLSTLPATLVSRARIVRFSTLSNVQLQPLLEGVDDDDAQFLLRLSQGAPGTLCQLRDNPDRKRHERLLYQKAVSFWESTSLLDRLQILSPLHARSDEAHRFLLHLALVLREQGSPPDATQALSAFASGLKTNAQRQLLAQRFALAVT